MTEFGIERVAAAGTIAALTPGASHTSAPALAEPIHRMKPWMKPACLRHTSSWVSVIACERS